MGAERGQSRESLSGFCELHDWGHAKLLKAASSIWAPGVCLFLTSSAWGMLHLGSSGIQTSAEIWL